MKITVALGVEMSYLRADRSGDTVHFSWKTATETGLAGFNLYMQTDSGQVQVNDILIPSSNPGGDSFVATGYTYSAAVEGDVFYVEMVGTDDSSDFYGPYTVGEAYGVPEIFVPIPVAWLPLIKR